MFFSFALSLSPSLSLSLSLWLSLCLSLFLFLFQYPSLDFVVSPLFPLVLFSLPSVFVAFPIFPLPSLLQAHTHHSPSVNEFKLFSNLLFPFLFPSHIRYFRLPPFLPASFRLFLTFFINMQPTPFGIDLNPNETCI